MTADCKVRLCAATNCIHNKSRRCTLEFVEVDWKGMCNMFNEKGAKPKTDETPRYPPSKAKIKDFPWKQTLSQEVPWKKY